MSLTAKEYQAKTYLITMLSGIPALLMVLAGSLLLALLFVVLSIVVYFYLSTKLADLLKEKTQQIVFELPQFIRTFIYDMRAEKDIIVILEKYNKVVDKALRQDIETLIADMKLGNNEQDLQRFEQSIDVPQLSNFITCLIAALSGENQQAAFIHIANDMSILANENQKRILNKRPSKVKVASIPIVIMIVGIYLYAIVTSLVSGLGNIL